VERVGAFAGTWQSYDIGPGAPIVGAPGVLWSSSAVRVFATGQDGALRQFSASGSGAWVTSSLTPAGTLSVSGGVSAVQAGLKSEVFAVSKDATLLQVERVGAAAWQRYSIRPDVRIVGAPSAVWSSSGVSVFAAGQDGALRQFSVSEGRGWSVSVVTPAGTLSPNGGVSAVHVGAKFEVLAVSKDATLLQMERVGAAAWKRYSIRPDVRIQGAPSVVWSPSSVNVFAAGQDGSLRQFSVSVSMSGAGAWSVSALTPAETLLPSGGVTSVAAGAKSEVFAAKHP
jgi:hypothetical protein